MSDATCPHCGRTTSSHEGLTQHARRCERNPDVRAAIMALLPDPDNPGRARAQQEYDALAKAHRTTRAETLVQKYRSWTNVCTALGLLPDVRCRTNGSVDRYAKEIDAENRDVGALVRHVRADLANPGLPVGRVRVVGGNGVPVVRTQRIDEYRVLVSVAVDGPGELAWEVK